jgi:hypothetical protein
LHWAALHPAERHTCPMSPVGKELRPKSPADTANWMALQQASGHRHCASFLLLSTGTLQRPTRRDSFCKRAHGFRYEPTIDSTPVSRRLTRVKSLDPEQFSTTRFRLAWTHVVLQCHVMLSHPVPSSLFSQTAKPPNRATGSYPLTWPTLFQCKGSTPCG